MSKQYSIKIIKTPSSGQFYWAMKTPEDVPFAKGTAISPEMLGEQLKKAVLNLDWEG